MKILADALANFAAPPLCLSIILCCHNSARRLQPTLQHLLAQTGLAGDRWEVVVVDNASSDETAAAAQAIWRDGGAPAILRVIPEPKLGLMHARSAGIAAARYEILSFVDDDNWVCPSWCLKILELMTTFPDLGVIGARSEAAFEPGQQVPPWFPALQHGYAVGPQGTRSGWVDALLPRFYGAGLTIRRTALQALYQRGFAALLTGRSGDRLSAGEDTELCYALGFAGWRFWYEDSLRLAHFMPPGRLTESYAERLFHGLGFCSAVEDFYLERAPRQRSFNLGASLRRSRLFRHGNAIRNLLRHRLKASFAPKDSPLRSLAQIEASFFQGRLEGMRDSRRNRTAFAEQIARWARV